MNIDLVKLDSEKSRLEDIRKQINNGTNHYVFEKNLMQDYIQHNLNKRRKIKLAKEKQQQTYIQNNQHNIHNLMTH